MIRVSGVVILLLGHTLFITAMKISILGSGSEGNATYVELAGVHLLIDAGFSGKSLFERFQQIGVDPACLDALLVTHEHIDHIKGVGIVSRKLNLPVYITPESFSIARMQLGKIADDNLKLVHGEFWIEGRVLVTPFDVNHDAARTVGYRMEEVNGKRVVVTTDIGSITSDVAPFFNNADVVVIESNYDMGMLQACDYPYLLKQRIGSSNGHLSNEDSCRLVGDLYHPNLKKVYLAHVSRNSNTYDIALQTTLGELTSRNITLDVEVAYQHRPTPLFEL